MKLLLFLLTLYSCTQDIVTPCEFSLGEKVSGWIDVEINSPESSVLLCTFIGEEKVCQIITKHFYKCTHIKRESTPMIFQLNNCKQSI